MLLLNTTLPAEIYNDYKLTNEANASKTKNHFTDGTFQEIIRFDKLIFEEDSLNEDNLKSLNLIIEKIKKYIHEHKKIYITIVGHRASEKLSDIKNEEKAKSKTYASIIQSFFRDSNKQEKHKNYATIVKNYMIEKGIDKDSIVLELLKEQDNTFSYETKYNYMVSNRVMISLYVEEE
jgi:hypothetical protein